MLRIRRGPEPALLLAALSRFSAQPPDPVQADSHATLLQMSPQALRPETFPDSPVDCEHLRFQGEVPATFFRVTCACATHGGRSSVPPTLGTLAARGSLVAFVQSAPHLDAFAKYVANLLRRARSVLTSTSQRLACASSASISVSGFRRRSTTSFSLPAFVAPPPPVCQHLDLTLAISCPVSPLLARQGSAGFQSIVLCHPQVINSANLS